MDTTTDRPVVSDAQYKALQTPDEKSVMLPTPQDLFDFEVRTLKDKGLDLPKQDVDRLRALVPRESQLFVVFPRPDQLDLNGLMALIEVGGKTGRNYLDEKNLTNNNAAETPSTAHLLVDVEDGRGRLNTRPSVSFANIKGESRIPYTAWYGLVHAIAFPCVLQDHCLDLCGSIYNQDFFPGLFLDDSGVPTLDYFWEGFTRPRWGVPSAGRVVHA